MTERIVYTVQEAADYIGISRTTMYQWIAKRLIPYEELAPKGSAKRIIRIRKEDIDAYLNRNYVTDKPKKQEASTDNVHGLFLVEKGAA